MYILTHQLGEHCYTTLSQLPYINAAAVVTVVSFLTNNMRQFLSVIVLASVASTERGK